MTGLHLSLSNASGVNTNLVMFCDMLLLSVSYMKKKTLWCRSVNYIIILGELQQLRANCLRLFSFKLTTLCLLLSESLGSS